MQYRTNVFSISAVLFSMVAFVPSKALAKNMTAEECGSLRQQQQVLVAKGLTRTVAKGASWAATNLNAEQISEVGVFLNLGEKIRFRCDKIVFRKKRKTASLGNVPLPVRNSRRVQQKQKAEQAKKTAPEKTAPESTGNETGEKMAPETKAVLSAVTGGATQTPAKAPAGMQKAAPDGGGAFMRKTLEE